MAKTRPLIVETRLIGFGGSYRQKRVRELAENEDPDKLPEGCDLAPDGSTVTDWETTNAHQ